MKQDAEKMAKLNEKKTENNHKFRRKLNKLEEVVQEQVKKIEEKKEKLDHKEQLIKKDVNKNITYLMEYIFPIEKVCSSKIPGGENQGNQDTVLAIAEASKTTYEQGHWTYSEKIPDYQYRIIAPLLPCNGDLSAYFPWASGDVDKSNAALSHKILAAKALTAGYSHLNELVDRIAYYLDTNLPKKTNFRDFSGELDEYTFKKKVRRLNYNIMYLCQLKNPFAKVLNVSHGIQNLLTYFGNGSSHPEKHSISDSFDDLQEICDLVPIDYSDSDDDDDTISADWETLPAMSQFEESGVSIGFSSSPGTGNIPSSAGVMSSVMSLWRGISGPNL